LNIIRFKNDEARSNYVKTHLQDSFAKKGNITLALSGGSTPVPFFQYMASHNLTSAERNLKVLWLDERIVPLDDERNNATVAIDLWLSKEDNTSIHRIDTGGSPEKSAKEYNKLVESSSIDEIVLGMGMDGHIASIFPNKDDIHSKKCFHVFNENDGTWRVSMSLSQILRSENIFLLVSGEAKLNVLEDVESSLPVHQLLSHANLKVLYCD